MAEVSTDFRLIDTLKKENMHADYTDLNPNASIPMLTHGHTRVIGDGEAIFNYLLNTKEDVQDKFFDEDQQKKINEMNAYFSRTIRRVTSKLIQAVVNPVVFGATRKVDDSKI